MIVSIVNQKGGVGKTTTAVNLADNLARIRNKTLLIDLDPQGNATSSYGFDKKAQEATIYDTIINRKPIEEIVLKDVRKNLDLIPSNIDLAGAEVELVSIVSRETILKQALDSIKQEYEIIIIDCPPSLGLLTVNALTASDSVIIPIQAEYYALEGLSQLLETIGMIRENLNPELFVLGVLVTMFDTRTQLSHQVTNEINNYFSDLVFNTVIPRNVRLSEAPSFGLPIQEHDKWSKGARSYKALAKEVAKRIINRPRNIFE
ncbi:MAG TPA: ParA family protein [Clostridiaceae bacterium]|nr:ParA family protein [Clostridiaceae bacterium]